MEAANPLDINDDPSKQSTPHTKVNRNMTGLVRTSKTLSYVLRHGAQKEGLEMRPDGYVKVEDLLKLPKLGSIGFLQLEQIVKEDSKGRYNLLYETAPSTWRQGSETSLGSVWWIRANQGHSLNTIEVEMRRVTDPSQCPVVVHGTNRRAWDSIQKKGLSKMNRNHIHFAQGLPGVQGVISGMRNQADVYIYIDIGKALKDNYEFFISQNGVVLCAGNEAGFLPKEYFLRVETVWKNFALPGYEGKGEKSSKLKVAEFDEKANKNTRGLGRKPKRRYKWDDPIQDLLNTKPESKSDET